jgi:hypothetical protein
MPASAVRVQHVGSKACSEDDVAAHRSTDDDGAPAVPPPHDTLETTSATKPKR